MYPITKLSCYDVKQSRRGPESSGPEPAPFGSFTRKIHEEVSKQTLKLTTVGRVGPCSKQDRKPNYMFRYYLFIIVYYFYYVLFDNYYFLLSSALDAWVHRDFLSSTQSPSYAQVLGSKRNETITSSL